MQDFSKSNNTLQWVFIVSQILWINRLQAEGKKRVNLIVCKLPLTQWICSDLGGHGLPTYLEKILWISIKWPNSTDLNTAFPIYITSVSEPDVTCADT